MPQHPLQHRLQVLRSRIVRLLVVRGLSVVVASVLGLGIGLALIDYAVRFRDRGVLVIFAVCLLAVLAWTTYRLLSRLGRVRLGDAELALHVEACFPAVRDRLASAVEFLGQSENDRAAGSAAMRRTAIAQATAACDLVDFNAALNSRPVYRTAFAAAAVMLVAIGLVVLNPAAARTAFARLALPLGGEVWPQRNHLQIRDRVERIARGQALEVEVVDAGGARLPECRIHFRLRNSQGKTTEESDAMRPLGDSVIARRENLTHSLEYRVTGGDDQAMPWLPIEVLEPPMLTGLALDVVPPDYTNWPRQTRDAASTLPILAGSRVELSGTASKALASAALRLEGSRELHARITGDGHTFRIGEPSAESPAGLVLDKSAAYTISLVDRDGIRGGEESWQFHVESDAPPTATIERPKTDLFVTPRARVDLAIKAYDDLGLRQVRLVYSSSGGMIAGEKSLALYEGPPRSLLGDPTLSGGIRHGDQQAIDHRWDLEELQLLPGTQLTVAAVASDYRGQIGRSEPRRFTIITPEELQERLAARQTQILAELARLLKLQRDCRERVRGLAIHLHAMGHLEQNEIDGLQSAEFNQREIVRSLTDRGDGLWAIAASVLADLEMNRVDSPDFVRRMQGLLDELARLEHEQFPVIGDELTAAGKGVLARMQASHRPTSPDAENEAHLAAATDQQQQVIESLESLLSQLRQWDDYRRFQRDVAQLLRDQEDVARGTAELGQQTVTRDLKDFSPQELADLTTLAERQFELLRCEQRIEQEMDQTIAALRANEPLAAETLDDALAEARRLGIAAAMNGAGGEMQSNALGKAPAHHQTILQDLQTVLDILANHRAQEDERLDRALGEAQRDLEGLRSRHEGLRRKLEELARAQSAGKLGDAQKAELRRLSREEDALRQETLRMARRLQRLLADEAAEEAKKAADEMGKAGQAADQGDAKEASTHSGGGQASLDETMTKLKSRRDLLKIQREIEAQARLEDAIKHLHHQQTQIQTETREFAEMERTAPLTRGQIFGLLELARQQTLLGDETDRLAKSLDAKSVFAAGLGKAEDEMRRSAGLLAERQTGTATQQAEQAAIDRLAMFLAALTPEKEDNAGKNDADSGPNGNGPKGDKQPQGSIMLAEVKAAKLWQEDLNRRTQQLHLDAANKPQEQFAERYAQLAEEQGRLGAVTMRLVTPEEGGAVEQKDKKE